MIKLFLRFMCLLRIICCRYRLNRRRVCWIKSCRRSLLSGRRRCCRKSAAAAGIISAAAVFLLSQKLLLLPQLAEVKQIHEESSGVRENSGMQENGGIQEGADVPASSEHSVRTGISIHLKEGNIHIFRLEEIKESEDQGNN